MNDDRTRWGALDDEALGRRLRMLAPGIVPTDVDLVDHVRSRLDARPRPHRGRTVAIAAAVVVVVVALVTAFTPTRTAVADWLGIGSTSVDIVDELPAATSVSRPSGAPPGHTATHDSIRDAAGDALGIDIELPSRELVGDPIGWDLDAIDQSPELTVAWTRFVITARVESSAPAEKLAPSADAVTRTRTADGEPALWIDGAHVRRRGAVYERTASTLLWVTDGVEYRLSGDLELAEALGIASSFG